MNAWVVIAKTTLTTNNHQPLMSKWKAHHKEESKESSHTKSVDAIDKQELQDQKNFQITKRDGGGLEMMQ